MPLVAQGESPTLAIAPGTAWLVGIALVGYAVALLAASLYAARRVRTEADYVVAGRRLPLLLMTGMADFYRRTYGPAADAVEACIQVPAYFSWVALQYLALAGILDLFFGLPQATGVVIVATITLLYTLLGGLWSVNFTDMIQMAIGLTGLVVLTATTLADPRLGAGDPLQGLAAVNSPRGPRRAELLQEPRASPALLCPARPLGEGRGEGAPDDASRSHDTSRR